MTKEFGEELERLRNAAGMTLRELARRIRITHGYLSDLERAQVKVPPSEATIVALAKELNASPLELCALAHRMPNRIAAQVLSDVRWMHVLLDARFRKVGPEQVLAFIRSKES